MDYLYHTTNFKVNREPSIYGMYLINEKFGPTRKNINTRAVIRILVHIPTKRV